MNVLPTESLSTAEALLRRMWKRHHETVLRSSIILMAAVSSVWLAYEFWRLLLQEGYWGAIDLRNHYEVLHGLLAGRPVYNEFRPPATYPPAGYLILWPFLGWLSFTAARWLWALTTVLTLLWLVSLLVRASQAETRLERTFVALMPLSMYATGAAIGNGQLIVHILPPLIAALMLARLRRSSWCNDILAALLFLFAVVKPSVTAPFFWIFLFCASRLRPAILVVLGYIGLTLYAASFQIVTVATLIRAWLSHPALGQTGQSNVRAWMVSIGLEPWSIPASLLVLAALGYWTYRHRHADLWLLLGVTSLGARFWMYHRWYDDLLIVLPMVALFRIAKAGRSDGKDLAAGVLLAITVAVMLAPGGLFLFPSPWNAIYTTGQTLIWFLVLFFLLDQSRNLREGKTPHEPTDR